MKAYLRVKTKERAGAQCIGPGFNPSVMKINKKQVMLIKIADILFLLDENSWMNTPSVQLSESSFLTNGSVGFGTR